MAKLTVQHHLLVRRGSIALYRFFEGSFLTFESPFYQVHLLFGTTGLTYAATVAFRRQIAVAMAITSPAAEILIKEYKKPIDVSNTEMRWYK